MDLISLSAVNAKSPYKIDSDQSGSFFFVTDKQRPYHVAFIEDSLFYEHGIYQYCLDTDMHAEADGHVYEAVVALMEEFFKSSAMVRTRPAFPSVWSRSNSSVTSVFFP